MPRRARRGRAAPAGLAVSLTRSPTTCAGWAPGPAPASARSRIRTCSPAPRSCPARSTPSSRDASIMVCFQVIGNDTTVTMRRRDRALRAQRHDAGHGRQRHRVDPAADQRPAHGRPMIRRHPRQREHCAHLAESSPTIVTPLNRYIGYENAAKKNDEGREYVKGPISEQLVDALSSIAKDTVGSSSPLDEYGRPLVSARRSAGIGLAVRGAGRMLVGPEHYAAPSGSPSAGSTTPDGTAGSGAAPLRAPGAAYGQSL